MRTAAEVAAAAANEAQIRSNHPGLNGLKTGLAAFDGQACMGFAPEAFVVIAAATGTGKTILADQFALAFAHQTWTLLVTLETSGQDAMNRMAANYGRVHIGRVRDGFSNLPQGQLANEYLDALEAIGQLPLGFVDSDDFTEAPTALDVWDKVEEFSWNKAQGFGVVVVDQLSHLHLPVVRSRDQAERLLARGVPAPPSESHPTQVRAWSAKVLRIMAQKLGICVVVASQINRAYDHTERPTVHNLADSAVVGNEATMVVMPWIPRELKVEVKDPVAGQPKFTKEPNTKKEGSLCVVKGRDVPEFDVPVQLRGEYQYVEETSDRRASYTAPKAIAASDLEGLLALARAKQERRNGARFIDSANTRAAITAPNRQLEAKQEVLPVEEEPPVEEPPAWYSEPSEPPF